MALARVALGVEYDGRLFHGWQRQKEGVPTVQAALEYALAQVCGQSVGVIAAGRTDTGVHALMQVVHFDAPVTRPLTAWIRGVNAHLPSGVSVQEAQEVAADFHARFDAYERHYRYVLLSAPARPALLAGKVGWTHYALDVAKMQAAASLLLGEHDFSSFRASECQAKSPVKQLKHLRVYQHQGLICFDLAASAFLHHMVRNIVGALVYVGAGRLSVAEFQHIFEQKSRLQAPPTFMADGLYLTKVRYPERFGVSWSAKGVTWLWGENGEG
ncbi:MAG: tRNA pseudouridine(38-40) synthase TruA [Neisseriaceae bacterium]|nr:tRNA pseudouridine(38-40) synthase TruA [Neisseriaceae bacterium]